MFTSHDSIVLNYKQTRETEFDTFLINQFIAQQEQRIGRLQMKC